MALSEEALARLRARADAVRRGMQGGGDLRYLSLTGKNAIVEPGKTVVLRLGPRWDYAQGFIRDPKDPKKIIKNPKYDFDAEIFVPVVYHWWGATGARRKELCRRVLDAAEPCPLCEAAEGLWSGNETDQQLARDLSAKDGFLFNVLLGKYGERTMTEAGKPDWRILEVGNSVYLGIMAKVTGGEGQGFARGDIWNPGDGCDISITRPPKDARGVQYTVDCDPKQTPLYDRANKEEAARWTGWMTLLHDLEAEVAPEKVLSYDALYEAYYGTPPDARRDAAEAPGGTTADDDLPEDAMLATPGGDAYPASLEAEDAGFDAGFDLPGEPAPPPQPPARTAPAAGRGAPPPRRPAPPTAAPRPTPGRRR